MDLSIWQKLMDTFTKSFDVPTYTTDNEGNVVSQSGDFPFFCQMLRSKNDQCQSCAKEFAQKLMQDRKDVIYYYCHAGLLNIMHPLVLNGEQRGAIITSSIAKESRNRDVLSKVSESTGIEEEELADALKEIPILDENQIKSMADILTPFSKAIPDIVLDKVSADVKVGQLDILHKIAKALNSTEDLDKVSSSVLKLIKKIPGIEAASLYAIINSDPKRLAGPKDRENQENEILKSMLNSKSLTTISKIENTELTYPMIALPMLVGSNFVGIIIFYVFNVKEVNKDLLWVICDQVSMSIGNLQNIENIKEKAVTDKLTGLYNRELFLNVLEREIKKAQDTEKPISLTLLDIDDFKKYNDTHGHPQGDELLKVVADVLQKETRSEDIVGRYGGEEFIIISPDTTHKGATELLERIRTTIQGIDIKGATEQPSKAITASFGLVTAQNSEMSRSDLISKADIELYQAKDRGKNQISSTILNGSDA